MMRLSKEQVLILHTQLIQATGGSCGVRDDNMLDSALATPFQSFGGNALYSSIAVKAARLCYGLVKNHAMIDGNKRLGAHVMLIFLELNGCRLQYSQQELIDIILGVAASEKLCRMFWKLAEKQAVEYITRKFLGQLYDLLKEFHRIVFSKKALNWMPGGYPRPRYLKPAFLNGNIHNTDTPYTPRIAGFAALLKIRVRFARGIF